MLKNLNRVENSSQEDKKRATEERECRDGGEPAPAFLRIRIRIENERVGTKQYTCKISTEVALRK